MQQTFTFTHDGHTPNILHERSRLMIICVSGLRKLIPELSFYQNMEGLQLTLSQESLPFHHPLSFSIMRDDRGDLTPFVTHTQTGTTMELGWTPIEEMQRVFGERPTHTHSVRLYATVTAFPERPSQSPIYSITIREPGNDILAGRTNLIEEALAYARGVIMGYLHHGASEHEVSVEINDPQGRTWFFSPETIADEPSLVVYDL